MVEDCGIGDVIDAVNEYLWNVKTDMIKGVPDPYGGTYGKIESMINKGLSLKKLIENIEIKDSKIFNNPIDGVLVDASIIDLAIDFYESIQKFGFNASTIEKFDVYFNKPKNSTKHISKKLKLNYNQFNDDHINIPGQSPDASGPVRLLSARSSRICCLF